MLPYCTAAEFDRLTTTVVLRASMRSAVRMVVVQRKPWAKAAEENGVTESGILRAIRRIKQASTTNS